MRGRFISIEGGDGVGKSTQIRLLKQWLEGHDRELVLTREPGGTPGAEAIRTLLLNAEGKGWNMRAEALLFAAARSDHVESLIRPALEAGKWVLSDRFVDSSRAYQGFAGGLGDEMVMQLHQIGSKGFLPDLTLMLHLPAGAGTARARTRDGGAEDRIGGRESSFHAAVNAAFETIADAEPDRVKRVDASGDEQQVHRRIIALVEPLLHDDGGVTS